MGSAGVVVADKERRLALRAQLDLVRGLEAQKKRFVALMFRIRQRGDLEPLLGHAWGKHDEAGTARVVAVGGRGVRHKNVAHADRFLGSLVEAHGERRRVALFNFKRRAAEAHLQGIVARRGAGGAAVNGHVVHINRRAARAVAKRVARRLGQPQTVVRRARGLKVAPSLKVGKGNFKRIPARKVVVERILVALGAVALRPGAVVEHLDEHRLAAVRSVIAKSQALVSAQVPPDPGAVGFEGVGKAAP